MDSPGVTMEPGKLHTFAKESRDGSADIGAVAIFDEGF